MQEFEFNRKLSVSPSPHIKTINTVTGTMLDVILALLPAAVWGVIRFGLHALILILISVLTSVLAEALYELIMKKPITVKDLSAAVTGLMIGLMMPPKTAFWVPVIGSLFAVIIVKQLFGGIGKNIVNPAICARMFLMLCFPAQMVRFPDLETDVISSATSLVKLKDGIVPDTSLFNSVAGNISGCIGEVSVIALSAGFVYLLARKIVRWEIPVSMLGVVAIFSLIVPPTGDSYQSMMLEITSGSLLFCAFFAANDWTTTPVSRNGRLIFGAGCGIITVLIRYYGSYPDGTVCAILLMNLLTPFIESVTIKNPFGYKTKKGGDIL